jgi:hypothetical protein
VARQKQKQKKEMMQRKKPWKEGGRACGTPNLVPGRGRACRPGRRTTMPSSAAPSWPCR